MKCPKCQYISFGDGSRCRNCGYDRSLTEDTAPLDLPIGSDDQPLGPLADLPLGVGTSRQTELPLFPGAAVRDDAPLVTAPAVPRPPLAVRRGAVTLPKPRPRSADRPGEPELDLDDPPRIVARADRPAAADSARESAPAVSTVERAPVVHRLGAGLIDVLILGAVDAAVFYLTLRLTGLQLAEAASLPKVPLVAFLLLLNGGYLVLFTAAAGQTIGKMATGIRVVPHEPGPLGLRVPFGAAVVRAVSYFASLLPAGLGFLPIIFSQDGRTLHDRLSDTRVVKA